MSGNWDLDRLRKAAGLPQPQAPAVVTESWDADDDSDEDPDVKIAGEDKRQKAFEKKNKKELKAADQKPAPKAAEKKEEAPAKAEEKKAEPKKEEAPAKAEEKKEPAKRGAKPNANSKAQRAVSWIKSNPAAKRGEFIKYAAANLEMGSAYASAFFAKHRVRAEQKVANECFVLSHPHMPSFLLAENKEMASMQWVDASSPIEPIVVNSQAEADKLVKYMSEWKSQAAVVQKLDLTQFDKVE